MIFSDWLVDWKLKATSPSYTRKRYINGCTWQSEPSFLSTAIQAPYPKNMYDTTACGGFHGTTRARNDQNRATFSESIQGQLCKKQWPTLPHVMIWSCCLAGVREEPSQDRPNLSEAAWVVVNESMNIARGQKPRKWSIKQENWETFLWTMKQQYQSFTKKNHRCGPTVERYHHQRWRVK